MMEMQLLSCNEGSGIYLMEVMGCISEAQKGKTPFRLTHS